MKVLFIGKYPPIQGGTATDSFWRINALRQLNLDFYILTCATYQNEFFIDDNICDDKLTVLCQKIPWHIPYSQLYGEQLVSKALELCQKIDFDIIEGCYLFPYCFAAFAVAKLLRKPFLIRHAGSDLWRVGKSGIFDALLREMAETAVSIVTTKASVETWRCYGAKNTLEIESYVPNPEFFYKSDKKTKNAVFLGKITEKWYRGQLDFFFAELNKRDFHGSIDVYSNESSKSVFYDYFESKGIKTIFHNFVLPEKIPEILRNHKFILSSRIPHGIPEKSNIVKEAIMCGCTVICQDSFGYVCDLDYSAYIQNQISIYRKVDNG